MLTEIVQALITPKDILLFKLMSTRYYINLIIVFLFFTMSEMAFAEAYGYHFVKSGEKRYSEETVIGYMRNHTVHPKETLLDIARLYGLGFNEIQLLYPHIDPWTLKSGASVSIPAKWIIPRTLHQGVVINLPELRLYRFFPHIGMVKTYPVGIGDIGTNTPEGIYKIIDRKEDPAWTIPVGLREKYQITKVPPGPDNPLGGYWIGLSRKGYGIHGTISPWGVGRLVSHGCIRLYPEHIAQFYQEVFVGIYVEVIYEPVKLGVKDKDIYIEIHPDVYGKIDNMQKYTQNILQKSGLYDYISIKRVKDALQKKDGVPVLIGKIERGG